MSMVLDETKPKGLEIKTHGIGEDVVFLGDYEIAMEDFLIAAHYVLTNTNLRNNDSRLQFVKCVRSMKVTKGYPLFAVGKKTNTKRLATKIPPIIHK